LRQFAPIHKRASSAEEVPLAFEPIIDLEGLVYVDDSEADPIFIPREYISLDQLVAKAVSPDMLEDEPFAADLLVRFRDRLFAALQHVEKALVTMRTPDRK
jgi:hypothetical protein